MIQFYVVADGRRGGLRDYIIVFVYLVLVDRVLGFEEGLPSDLEFLSSGFFHTECFFNVKHVLVRVCKNPKIPKTRPDPNMSQIRPDRNPDFWDFGSQNLKPAPP